LFRMAQLVSKLASGSTIGSATEEGYIPAGIRIDVDANREGAERAIDMLLDKLAGRSFETEIPYESLEKIPVAPPIGNIRAACITLASTSGVTTGGNPYEFKMFRNTKFKKYSIGNLNSMKEASWDVLHGGYNTSFMVANPNYGVPLDACRELEREGAFGKLYPYFYGTTGVDGVISAMKNIGRGMVADMKAEGVDAVILVDT
jgi:betaine reductase